MEFDLFITLCNYIGTIAFAVSGAVKGFKKKLDIFGICLLSIITAVGGGIIRDIMANRIPTALTDPKPSTFPLWSPLSCIVSSSISNRTSHSIKR